MKAIGLIRVSTQVQQLESQSEKVKEAILRDGFEESDIILIEDKEFIQRLYSEFFDMVKDDSLSYYDEFFSAFRLSTTFS